MKSIFIPLIAIFAIPTAVEACIFGNCGSEFEARQACQKWASKGKTEIIKYKAPFTGNDYCEFDIQGDLFCDSDLGGDIVEEEKPLRSCNYDFGSKKILGIEKNKVRKRFKY
tara:strand:+ start:81 stop:416 length:336 start_codon:yes stop_codon:yes gene_type:complete